MPSNRTSGVLLLQLTMTRVARDRLQLENALLRNQLRRHASGELQIREVERRLRELRSVYESEGDRA